MTADLAHAIRRAVLVALGLATTMLAHQAAMDHRVLGPQALLALVLAVSAAVVVGHRGRAVFRPRGPLGAAGAVIASQALGHAAMGGAPWAFGMHAAPIDALLTPRALVAHLVAAALVWLLVLDLEGALAATIAAVRAVRRAVAPRRRGGVASARLVPLVRATRSQWVVRLAPSRGPPPAPVP